jgi:hypothetical protein
MPISVLPYEVTTRSTPNRAPNARAASTVYGTVQTARSWWSASSSR